MIGIVDIETGGFSITKNGVCEIAVVAVTPEYEMVDVFQSYIKPYKRDDSDELVSYKDDAMAVNGITLEQLELGTPVVHVVLNLFEFLEKNQIHTIVAHGKAFDIPRINYLGNRFVGRNLENLKIECSIELTKQKIKLPSYSLENLCSHFEIENTKSHSAMGDALATFELLKKLRAL